MSHQLMTKHAVERMSQRGVSSQALEVVLTYGADTPAYDGCLKRALRHAEVNEILADGISLDVVEAALKIEAVLSQEERLVTCYQRAPRCLNRATRRQRINNRYGRRV